MSYLVLARKWRPQTFTDLIGQEHVSRTLKNAIDTGRVAHAFLFTGARGVGKTSSARILAKALNCEQGMSPDPCNACPACSEITTGNSVDVFEIDGASNTSVDDIRELRENVRYLPSRCRYKIFIIDEVHMLSTSAFNALLKTLEEPPPHVKFIFATTEPHKVPITILSRCQRFDFRRIPLVLIAARLRFIVDREGVAVSDAALTLIARKGDGSMRDSLSTLDQVLAFCGETVSDDDVISLLGVVDRRLISAVSAAVLAGDSRALLDIVRQVDSYGYSMRQFCQELIDHFRDLTILSALGGNADFLEVSDAELAELQEKSGQKSLDDFQRYLTILLKTEAAIPHSGFPRLVLEMALLKMSTLVPAIPVNELLERLKALEKDGLAGSVAAPSPPWCAPTQASQLPKGRTVPRAEPVAAPAAPGVSMAAMSNDLPAARDWPGFVAFVKGKKVRLAALLEHGRPLVISREVLELGFPPEGAFFLASLRDGETEALLRKLAADYFGAEPAIKFVALAESGGSVPPSLAEKKNVEYDERIKQLQVDAASNPAVNAALEVFDGEIHKITELDNNI